MQNTNIGDRIAQARAKQGLSMQKLIDLINDDPSRPQPEKYLLFDRYKSWEYGKNAIPLNWIPTLCKHLLCDAGYLFGEYNELTRQNADICTATGFTSSAAHTIQNLDFVVGNRHFAQFENGTLSKRYILSQVIADERIIQVLIAAKQAKSLKYNLQKKVDPDVDAEEFSLVLSTLDEMNMVALQPDDSVNFYIQEAGRIFMDILRSMADSVSENESYSTDLIPYDSKTTIKKVSPEVWIIDSETAKKLRPDEHIIGSETVTKPTPAP